MKNRLLPFQGWRLTVFQAVVFAVFFIFAIRMYELQIINYEIHNQEANTNRLSSLPIAASRGAIRDRFDARLAFNVTAYNLVIVPADLHQQEEDELDVFNRLSALVDVPPTAAIARQADIRRASIEELVAEGEGVAPFRPVVIAQDIERRVMMQILEERIFMPGVDIQVVGVREYPFGQTDGGTPTTSHIIGYLGPIPPEEAEALREQGYNPAYDRIGYEGIERFLESSLGGTRGSRLREVDVAGEELGVVSEIPPIPGQSVRLTLDVELQEIAEELLQQSLANRNNPEYYAQRGVTMPRGLSTQGVVIAMDPNTGEILALVSLPTYENARFARAIDVPYYLDIIEDAARPLVNIAIKGLYPPGSVWKLITAAAVVEEDVISPEFQLRDDGQLIVENRYAPNDPAASQRFVCWLRDGHGLVDLVQSIAWSCDVYFYQVGGGNPSINPTILKPGGLGIDDLFRYATATGIGSELGVELPFENAGRMPDPDWKRRNYGENWSTGDTYNASFGQGYVTATPLQMIASVASLINGGVLHQPTVIREFFDQEGNIVAPFEPSILRTINPELVPASEPLILLLVEDMMMHGQTSLACVCEESSPWYDPFRCDPTGYRNVVNTSGDRFNPIWREYRIHIPLNYTFNGNICQPVRFTPASDPYQPAFLSTEALDYIELGMRDAVIVEGGTAKTAVLDDLGIAVAGKTGTAEYCDNIAYPLGYCVQGQWPAHAWYVGYAPYEDPEIIVIGFVYNGDEGSFMALPVVRETMRAYFELKAEREGALPDPAGVTDGGG